MKTLSLFKDEAELESIRELQKELLLQEKICADLPKKIARERMERERTMPPLQSLKEREQLNQYEQALATRRQYRNVVKAQSTSVLLLFMVIIATAALSAWSLRLMQG